MSQHDKFEDEELTAEALNLHLASLIYCESG